MPVWVDEEFNGWYGRGIIDAFDQYVRTCFNEFGDRVKYWLAINEQNMQIVYGDWLGVCKYPDTWFEDKWKVNHIMNLCHAKTVISCHELVEDEQNIAIASYDQENNIDIWILNLTTFNEKKERTVHSTLWRNNEHLYDFQVRK